LIQHEIKRTSNSGNAYYLSVQNFWPSRLLWKNAKISIYQAIILPVVLYGCETWFLTLREEHRQGVFENRVLRGIFGSRSEVTEGWRKLHNEELRDLYSLRSIIIMIKSRRMRWAGHVARMGRREWRRRRRKKKRRIRRRRTRIRYWSGSQREKGH
jgi:hypothetical protein